MALFFIMNEERRARRIQRTTIRDSANPFELSDQKFHHNYRINKPMALYLCRELAGALAFQEQNGYTVHIKETGYGLEPWLMTPIGSGLSIGVLYSIRNLAHLRTGWKWIKLEDLNQDDNDMPLEPQANVALYNAALLK